MSEVENILRCCNRNDDLFRTYIVCLLQLKHHNASFKKVYQELRADYLVRGICEREVDGIIKESKEYKKYDVPRVLRWDFLRNNPAIIETVCTTLFTYRRLNLSYEEWGDVIRCIENNELLP
ncbi:group-specific protein [Bacillus pseudomycoides]|uniref:Group-specific protein n=1 Tax=Bacillus bingmayongensis TaxID=1150157 RepID=A0ABU5K2T5_9BACI|nr:group-specific protein [Bacillus pseudomycoides]